jgi:hypothetical protein
MLLAVARDQGECNTCVSHVVVQAAEVRGRRGAPRNGPPGRPTMATAALLSAQPRGCGRVGWHELGRVSVHPIGRVAGLPPDRRASCQRLTCSSGVHATFPACPLLACRVLICPYHPAPPP